jgi:hypothetical protein
MIRRLFDRTPFEADKSRRQAYLLIVQCLTAYFELGPEKDCPYRSQILFVGMHIDRRRTPYVASAVCRSQDLFATALSNVETDEHGIVCTTIRG